MLIYFFEFFHTTIVRMIFQNIKHLFSYDVDFIHSLEISLKYLSLQTASSLVNSSLRFQIFSAAFAMFTFEHFKFQIVSNVS